VEGIARLLLRRGRLTPHVLVLCPDAGFMQMLDERLWTIHPESFLAHGVAGQRWPGGPPRCRGLRAYRRFRRWLGRGTEAGGTRALPHLPRHGAGAGLPRRPGSSRL